MAVGNNEGVPEKGQYSAMPSDKIQQAQSEIQEIPFKWKRSGHTLVQVTQRGCGVFINGDTQTCLE